MQFLSSSFFQQIILLSGVVAAHQMSQRNQMTRYCTFLSEANILIIIFTIFGFKDLDVIEDYEIYKEQEIYSSLN